jgi:hypothetical protein
LRRRLYPKMAGVKIGCWKLSVAHDMSGSNST